MVAETLTDKNKVEDVVKIHLLTFPGFFLTFLGKGFLKQLYEGFIDHDDSELLVAVDDNKNVIGFLAYSEDISAFYRYLIKEKLFGFAWYSFLAFLRKPHIMIRLLRAFCYSGGAKRDEKYIELSSIGVLPNQKGRGIGANLIRGMVERCNTNDFSYIKLETDADNN